MSPRLFRLDVCRPGHLRPFRDVIGKKLAELRRRNHDDGGAQALEAAMGPLTGGMGLPF